MLCYVVSQFSYPNGENCRYARLSLGTKLTKQLFLAVPKKIAGFSVYFYRICLLLEFRFISII